MPARYRHVIWDWNGTLLDDTDICELPLETVRASIGYAQQEAFLFSTTVARNIGYSLDDPQVIRNFSTEVQNPETLDLLTLLTFADAQATSDKLWNGFKDALLWSLYKKAAPLLTGGSEFIRAEEKQRELLMEEVSRLSNGTISNDELEAEQPRPGRVQQGLPLVRQAHASPVDPLDGARG